MVAFTANRVWDPMQGNWTDNDYESPANTISRFIYNLKSNKYFVIRVRPLFNYVNLFVFIGHILPFIAFHIDTLLSYNT